MREILFRGKCGDEWVYGYPYFDYDEARIITEENINRAYTSHGWFDGYMEEVIPETVGQYTGLTDKNGKKIFEGDIVLISDEFNETYLCIWEDDNFDYEFENKTMSFSICGVHKDDVEVVGNIHDNPELLGGDYCG